MAVYSFLAALFCILALALNLASIFILLRKRAVAAVSPYSLAFAALSLALLAAAALSCLLSAYTVMLPSALFLAAACLLLHFSAQGPVAGAEGHEAEYGGGFAAEESYLEGELPRCGDRGEAFLEAAQAFMERMAQAVENEGSMGEFLGFANEALVQCAGADGGVIFLVDDYEDVLNPMALSGQFPPPYKIDGGIPLAQGEEEEGFAGASIPLEGNVFGEAALSGEPILIRDAGGDPRVFANGIEGFPQPGSYIMAPLAVGGNVIGVAGLARLAQSEPFSENDLAAAKVLASCAAVAANALYSFQEALEWAGLEREHAVSAEVQRTMQPKQPPELPGIGFGVFFQPARGICSDYCDVIAARRDRIALIIADVAGKGIISSMVMMSIRAILHLITNTTRSSATIMGWLNRGITGKISVDHYATVAYLSYSMETREIEYANAGHLPVLVWRASEGKIESVHIDSDPIGVERNSEYKAMKLTVAPGDAIILFTDGIVEAINEEGKQYGIAGLSRAVSENAAASAKDIALAVKGDLRSFMGSAALHDDQTLLVMKIKGL